MRHIALAALLLFGCASEKPSFEAGQWEFSISMSEGPQRVFWGGGENCIDKAETAELPLMLLGQTALGQCTSSASNYAGGKVSLTASCDGKSAATTMPASTVKLEGTYAPTSFESRVSAQLRADAEVKKLSGTLTARRTGDCSPPRQGNAS